MMQEYIYVLRLVRSETADHPTAEEQAILEKHFAYFQAKLDEDLLVLAGRCEDKTFGITIFRAESEEAAQRFMHNDPAVKHNVMTAELHPFRIEMMVERTR